MACEELTLGRCLSAEDGLQLHGRLSAAVANMPGIAVPSLRLELPVGDEPYFWSGTPLELAELRSKLTTFVPAVGYEIAVVFDRERLRWQGADLLAAPTSGDSWQLAYEQRAARSFLSRLAIVHGAGWPPLAEAVLLTARPGLPSASLEAARRAVAALSPLAGRFAAADLSCHPASSPRN